SKTASRGDQMNKLRVLLADDHPVVLEGLKFLVTSESDIEVVGEVGTGRMAVELAKELLPDVVVMDLSMLDTEGAEAAEQSRRDCPSVRVLVLSVHETDGHLRRLLEAGATGYIVKRSAAGELVHAIREVAAGRICIDSWLAAHVVTRVMG